MSTQSESLTARGRVPDLDGFVGAAGRQCLPIWLPGERRDLVRVPERAENHLFGGDLPDPHAEIISTRRGESGAVGTPRQIRDQTNLSLQRDYLIAGMSARDGHRPVAMSAGKELIVRAPGAGENTARMGDLRGQLAGVGVPELDGAIMCPGSQARPV